MNIRSIGLVLAAATLLLVTGCRSSGLDMQLVRSTTAKPANVAVYFRVDQSDGTPVGGLKAENFKIYEDDKAISEFESKQTILNPTVAASHYTLLLIDMSGSVSKSGQGPVLVDAASAFTEKVEKYQKVGVYAFDGSPDLHPIVPFTASGGAAKGGVKSLASFEPRDPSTNLNGAVVRGLETLKAELAHAEHPLRIGTLVVFTDGTDHAGRVSQNDMRKAIKDSEYDVFAIGLGAEISERELKDIGKNGTAMAQDKGSVVQAFDQIAQKIEGYTKRYYLLSYCTPARAGDHEVTLEATVKTDKAERRGSVGYRFTADNFGPGCDPNTPPSFDVTKGDAVAPKKPADEKPKPADEKAKPAVKRPHAHEGKPEAAPHPAKSGDYNP
jgi:hypothetical protein